MGSTELMVYLNYISTWEDESEGNIDLLIKELNYFTSLGSFDSDQAIDDEFDSLLGIVDSIEFNTIASDSAAISADAAAIFSIFSFGLGMGAYIILEGVSANFRRVLNNESEDLVNKLNTIDEDISKKINPDVFEYVKLFKSNNHIIANKNPIGMDGTKCRAVLLQFMAYVQSHGELTANSFKRYAGSARAAYQSKEIDAVYDALDELNLSEKNDADVDNFIKKMNSATVLLNKYSTIVTGVALTVALKSLEGNQSYKRLEEHEHVTEGTQTEEGNLTVEGGKPAEGVKPAEGIKPAEGLKPVEGVRPAGRGNNFRGAKLYGKMAFAVIAIASVYDITLQILDIADTLKRYNELSHTLDKDVRKSYKEFFDGIKDASLNYQNAVLKN